VVLNTDAAVDEFASHYRTLPASKFVAIPNGYDPDLQALVAELERDAESRAQNRPFRLCHAGDLYGKRSILPLIKAIGILTEAGLDVELAQFGNCDDRVAVAETIRDLGLAGKVFLHEKIPHREALREMACADLLVAIQPGTALQIPGKLYEMMLFDKPLLVLADGGATAELVSARGLGKVAPCGDPLQIAQAVRSVCEGAIESRNFGVSRSRVAEFDGRSLTGRLAALFSAVCGIVAAADADSSSGGPLSRSPVRGGTALAGVEPHC
jgi:glycosyltransferase involved in cell wall biosynthesis